MARDFAVHFNPRAIFVGMSNVEFGNRCKGSVGSWAAQGIVPVFAVKGCTSNLPKAARLALLVDNPLLGLECWSSHIFQYTL